MRITGTELTGSEISLAGNVSSQYISALLMIGTVLPKGLRLHLTGDIISRPYINLTLQLMRDFGAQADWVSEDCITVSPGGYTDTPFTVESDWSAASYWYQMMAIEGIKNEKIKGGDRSSAKESEDSTKEEAHTAEIELLGLFAHSYQGDSRGAEVFTRLGVHTEYTDRGVKLTRKGTPATRLDEDMVDIPDLAQTFVVTCCLMDIPFRFTGLPSLRNCVNWVTSCAPSKTASCCGMANAARQTLTPSSPPTKTTVWPWHLPPPALYCPKYR